MLQNVFFATTTHKNLSVISVEFPEGQSHIANDQEVSACLGVLLRLWGNDNTLCLLLESTWITHKESHSLAEEGVMDIQAAWRKVEMLAWHVDFLMCSKP